jgi:hypothetical protein
VFAERRQQPADFNAIRQLGRGDKAVTRPALGRAAHAVVGIVRFDYVNVLDDTEVVIPGRYACRSGNAAVTQSSATFVKDLASLPVLPTTPTRSRASGRSTPLEDIQRIRLAAGRPPLIPLNLANPSAVSGMRSWPKHWGCLSRTSPTAIAVAQ